MELASAVIIKAVAITALVLAVVQSGLSPFEQALIIAISSALVTGLFTIAAAFIATKLTRPAREQLSEVHQKVIDE